MSRRRGIITAVQAASTATFALGVVSCASLLGYDDLSAIRTDAGADAKDGSVAEVDGADVTDTAPTSVRPPVRPMTAPTPSGSGKTMWLIVTRFYMGSLNHAGSKIGGAWREWGYDLDHVCTGPAESKTNIGTCRRAETAAQDMLVDGSDCRDNNFGSHLIPLLSLSADNLEERANAGLVTGNPTLLLRIDDVDAAADDPYAPAKLYRAARTSVTQKFDGTDVRTISSDSILGGDVEKPVTSFPKGYIKDNTWVSGEPESFEFLLPVIDRGIPISMLGATITLPLDPGRTTGADIGLIAGGIPLPELENFLRPLAIAAKLCPGSSLYLNLLNTIQQYPDLVAGAPNLQDVNVSCDTLSAGIGLAVSRVVPPTAVVAPTPPPPDDCSEPDAGTKG